MATKKQPRKYSLSIHERSIPSSIAKICCERVYGKSIGPPTWTNWRRWAGIPARSRRLNFEQFCFVLAIAEIRRRQYPEMHTTELNYQEVLSIAQSVEINDAAAGALREMDFKGFIWGHDAMAALSNQGIQVARSTLYKKIPGFSLDRIYKLNYLQAMCG